MLRMRKYGRKIRIRKRKLGLGRHRLQGKSWIHKLDFNKDLWNKKLATEIDQHYLYKEQEKQKEFLYYRKQEIERELYYINRKMREFEEKKEHKIHF